MNSLQLTWTRQSARKAFADAATLAAWDRLNAARGNVPFLSAYAVDAALVEFGEGSETLCVARHGAEVVAMAVLVPDGAMQWRTFQPSQIPLGCWVAAAEVAVTDLAASLLRGVPGLCLAVSLTQIDPRLAERPADGDLIRPSDYIVSGWLAVDGSFEGYWAARGKNLRQNMRKQRNRLQADGVATRMLVWQDEPDMAAALARYGELETQGWKAGRGTAVDAATAQGRFYLRLLQAAARAGEARVFEYRFDERTVAMNLCLLRSGELIVLKTAYDESIKSLSPAFLLREEELQRFFAPGSEVRRIEYYGRLMDWHTKLTDTTRTLFHLTCYRWSWVRHLADRRRKHAEAAARALADAAPATPAAQSPSAAEQTTTA